MKYKLYYIECHNPYNHLNDETIPEFETKEVEQEGIENIIKEYEAIGAKAKCMGIDNGDRWGEFEITHEFEANNIEEAKQKVNALYDGSADTFSVYDETGKRVLTEEGIE